MNTPLRVSAHSSGGDPGSHRRILMAAHASGPRSVPAHIIAWREHIAQGAGVRAFLAAPFTRTMTSRLPSGAAAFLHAPLVRGDLLHPAKTRSVVHVSTADSNGYTDDDVEALIDAIAERVRDLTPTGVPGVIVETAIAAALEQFEPVVASLERRVASLVDQTQIDRLNTRLDALLADIPTTAAAAVNDTLADLQISANDVPAMPTETQENITRKLLDQIPQAVEVYMKNRGR